MASRHENPCVAGLVELAGRDVTWDLDVARAERIGCYDGGKLEKEKGTKLWLEGKVARRWRTDLHEAS